MGHWAEERLASRALPDMRKNKALFLDRDGVINVYHPYVRSREEFHFREGIFELCRAAQSLDYLLLVVTNQSGIARGYFTESDFLELTEWMLDRFGEQQINIARVYYCPYHPVYGVGRYKFDSPFRKPNPGMFLRARTDFGLDLAGSVLIGDKLLDMDAAKAAGVGTKILLRSGPENIDAQEDNFFVSDSLDDIRCRFFSPPR
jgi:D-glycero-D-manno-heptose 1,7-bisphosphate phosphatase